MKALRGQQLKRLENCAQRDDSRPTMKSQLIAIVAAVLVVGCGPSVDIHQAAERGDIETVKQHLAAGVDVNAKDRRGWTPLDSTEDEETAALLRKHGGKHGVIHGAVGPIGDIEAVKEFLATGTDVNAKEDELGMPPLSVATTFGHKEIVELLIAEGANVNAKDENSLTPLDWAIYEDHPEIADLLRKHGAKESN